MDTAEISEATDVAADGRYCKLCHRTLPATALGKTGGDRLIKVSTVFTEADASDSILVRYLCSHPEKRRPL